MEGNLLKTVPLNVLSSESPYQFRYSLDDSFLESSISKYGILDPLWVQESTDKKFVLIAGHKRFNAAVTLKLEQLPVRVFSPELSAQKTFLFSILSNWNQTLSDLDKTQLMIKALRDFKFSEEDFLSEVVPALGLVPGKHLVTETMKMAALEPCVFDALAEQSIPLRGVVALLKFPKGDQIFFVQHILEKIHLTSSGLQKVVELLFDAMRESFLSLEELVKKESSLKEILEHADKDKRQSGEAFANCLWAMRNPRLSDCEKQFKKKAREIRGEFQDLQIESPPFFEDQGMTLHAKLKSPGELEKLLAALQKKRSSFNELFEIML